SSPACCSACGRGTSRVSGLTRCSASTSAAGQPRRSCRRIWTNSKGKRRTPASNYRAERYCTCSLHFALNLEVELYRFDAWLFRMTVQAATRSLRHEEQTRGTTGRTREEGGGRSQGSNRRGGAALARPHRGASLQGFKRPPNLGDDVHLHERPPPHPDPGERPRQGVATAVVCRPRPC